MSDIKNVAMITVCGRPNVGKSSLTNALVGEKVAIVSLEVHTSAKLRFCPVFPYILLYSSPVKYLRAIFSFPRSFLSISIPAFSLLHTSAIYFPEWENEK